MTAAVLFGAGLADAEAEGPPVTSPALAGAPAPSATPGGPPTAAALAEAKARFQRALELHDEGNLDAARTELRRAYETAPNFRVLYNLAQLEFELLDYAAALATFEKYLSEGGARIPKDRRAQVQNDVEKLRGRVGSIEIAVNVAGSQIAVDDVPVGTSPLLRPITVSAGKRRIAVSHPGYASEARVVDVAGGDHSTLSFELVDPSRTATPPPAPTPAETVDIAPATTPPPAEAPAPPPPTPEPPKANSVPWVGWVATALLAGGAGVTGGLALQRSQRLSSDRARYGIEQDDLNRLQREATIFAVASDICAGTAAFAGVISLYLTLSSNGTSKPEQSRAVRVAPSLGFVSVEGTF